MTKSNEEYWIFTFGCGQSNEGKYVKIYGSFNEARAKMFDMYGDRWALQYSAEQWEKWESERPPYIPVETILRTIY